jgi:hypothetical protein
MKKLLFSFTLALACSDLSSLLADVPVKLNIDTSKATFKIPDDYAGLSYETKLIKPGDDGKYYFRPDNTALATMFRTLGLKSLRIGGNMVDKQSESIPTDDDIDQLFGFAKLAGVKVIYSFRLNKGDPEGSAAQAKYIHDKYADSLLCFSIGNEPDIYIHSWDGYKKAWDPIYNAIIAAVPDAKFLGPSLTSNEKPWAADFAREYYPSGRILYIAQHEYAGGDGFKQKDPAKARDLLLSSDWPNVKYQKYYDKFVPPLNGAAWRLEEANNFYNGGAKDASDTFASALWGLDYLYWYANHGGQGVNFHNGNQVAAGQNLTPCRYASFTSTDKGYFAHPLAYADKVFNLGSKGTLVSSEQKCDTAINLVSYAVLGNDKNLYITLINKSHDIDGQEAEVTLTVGPGYTKGETIALTAPNNDVSQKEGVTIGGNPINEDGTWKEQWTPLASAPSVGKVSVEVPPASALLVKLVP